MRELLAKLFPRWFKSAPPTSTTLPTGQWAENTAKDHLQNRGLRFNESNYRCKLGEIDLIMQDKETLVFVEVRSRNNSRFGSGLESVNQYKQAKLIRAAKHYLQTKRLYDKCQCRFDVVSVSKQDSAVEWIANAFEAH